MPSLCNYKNHWRAKISSTVMRTQGRSSDSSFLFIKCLSICTLLWTATLVMRTLRKSAPLDRVYISEQKWSFSYSFFSHHKKTRIAAKALQINSYLHDRKAFSTYWLNTLILVLFRTSAVHNKYACRNNF